MTKEEFISAFRAAASAEFENIPENEDEIRYDFSPAFEKKMKRLIREENHPSLKLVGTARRKAVTVILIAAIILASVFSVGAVRDTVREFLVTAFEKYFALQSGETELDKIEHIYTFSEIPEGFHYVAQEKDNVSVSTTYENKNGIRLRIFQELSGKLRIVFDKEKGQAFDIKKDGETVKIYISKGNNMTMAFWIQEEYVMKATYYGEISEEKLLEYIKLIK